MPTPLGHAIAGVAAGWAIARPVDDRRRLFVQAALLAALGVAPDLDLLIGRHSGETHSIGAAAIVATMAAWLRWPIAETRWRIWMAAWLAWSTHPLLDALSPDNSAPIGIMAFWPFSQSFVQTGLAVFAPIWRYPVTLREIQHDLLAAARETLILLPLCWLAWRRRGRGGRRCFPQILRFWGRRSIRPPSPKA